MLQRRCFIKDTNKVDVPFAILCDILLTDFLLTVTGQKSIFRLCRPNGHGCWLLVLAGSTPQLVTTNIRFPCRSVEAACQLWEPQVQNINSTAIHLICSFRHHSQLCLQGEYSPCLCVQLH